MLGCLFDYEFVSKLLSVYWGCKSDGVDIWLNIIDIVNVYNEVMI